MDFSTAMAVENMVPVIVHLNPSKAPATTRAEAPGLAAMEMERAVALAVRMI